MSAGIEKYDAGFVSGVNSTWHGLPQYVCIPDRPITIAEAIEVANYPLEKVQTDRITADGHLDPIEGAFHIVRTDHDEVLVPMVGSRFAVADNSHMVNTLNENLLCEFPDLCIESVGTLFNGATFFLNLKIKEFAVRGDKSATITNLMYANPLGKGSYVACAHNTRIVCNNTERVAEAQGTANQSLGKFRHTAGAELKINDHLVDIAELCLGLEKHEQLLSFMADEQLGRTEVESLLDRIFPVALDELGKVKSQRAETISGNNKLALLNIFDGTEHRETMENPHTAYGFYQSYTDWVDHQKSGRGDRASITMDGIIGSRATSKQKVLDMLVKG